jgi:DNA-binding HxlR family transcriptional regulator
MEENRFIRRKIFHETPIGIEYYLTEKGRYLNLYFTSWLLFPQYCANDIFKDEKSRTLQQVVQQ